MKVLLRPPNPNNFEVHWKFSLSIHKKTISIGQLGTVENLITLGLSKLLLSVSDYIRKVILGMTTEGTTIIDYKHYSSPN